jgi:WD40 repeat protein
MAPWLLALLLPTSAGAADPLSIRAVAFSPDGKLLAVAAGEPAQSGAVALWEVATRKQRWHHAEMKGVPAVAFSPDGRTLAIGSFGSDARLLDVANGEVKRTLPHPNEVRGVAFSRDGRLLATACWDKRVRVWDLAAGTEKVTCTGHNDRIFTVAFAPDGRHLLSVGGDDGAKLWDAATGLEQRTFKHYYMPCGQFSPDGRWVITGSYDGTTRLWNVETGEMRARFSGTGGVHQLAFSQAARTLAVCGYGRGFALFDLDLREPEAKDLNHIRALLEKLNDDSYDARVAAGKELLAVGFGADAELRKAMQEAKSAEVRVRARWLRQEMLSKPRAHLRGHTGEVHAVAFSPDGKLLASGSSDGTARLWEVTSRQEVGRLEAGR